MPLSSSNTNNFFKTRTPAQIGIFIMVILGIIVSLLLLRNRQEIRQEATSPTGTATLSLSPVQPVPEFPNNYKVDLYVNMGVSQVNIDGIQLIATLTGQIPSDLTFTPATIPSLSVINPNTVLTDSANGKNFSLVYLTSNPSAPFVGNDQPLLLGTFSFSGATGSMTFSLDATQAKINQNVSGTDILLPLSPVTINPAVCSLLVSINSSATPTPTPTNSPTVSPSNTPTPTPTPTPGTGGNTPTPTPTPSNTPTPTPSGTPRPMTDLELQKTVNNTTPTVGQEVTFTIQTTNKGPNNATGVAVKDVLPGGLTYISSTSTRGSYSNSTNIWTIGNLNVNETVYLYVTVRVDSAASITNVAEVYSNDLPDVDSTPNNNVTGEDDQDDVTLNSTKVLATCNQSCTYNSDCSDSNQICYGTTNPTCRLASNPNSSTCAVATASPTPIPQLPQSGLGGSSLFIVVGIVVLLLGALAVLLLI